MIKIFTAENSDTHENTFFTLGITTDFVHRSRQIPHKIGAPCSCFK